MREEILLAAFFTNSIAGWIGVSMFYVLILRNIPRHSQRFETNPLETCPVCVAKIFAACPRFVIKATSASLSGLTSRAYVSFFKSFSWL